MRRNYRFPENLLRRLRLGENGCVEFTGTKTARGGYGRVWRDGVQLRAHRAMWELMVGPIPEGLTIDHLCGNTACVNPAHLEPCTAAENVLRSNAPPAINARKTHCKRGHPLSGSNLRFDPRGQRVCRECQRQHRRAHKARKRAAA